MTILVSGAGHIWADASRDSLYSQRRYFLGIARRHGRRTAVRRAALKLARECKARLQQ